MLDVRAAISSGFKYKALSEIKAKIKADGGYDTTQGTAVLDAVEYAMAQKYKKAITRAISFIGGAISMSVGIAVLAGAGVVALVSNPAGWGVLTALAAVGAIIGVSLLIYKLSRWFYKRFISGQLRQKRHGFAVKMYKALLEGDQYAAAAVTALGLSAADVKASGLAARAAEGRQGTEKQQKEQKAHLDKLKKDREHQEYKIAKWTTEATEERRKARMSFTPSIIERHNKAAAAADKKVDEHKNKLKLVMGETEWKSIPKKERDIVRMIFKKLG
jgi:hypothetical protein